LKSLTRLTVFYRINYWIQWTKLNEFVMLWTIQKTTLRQLSFLYIIKSNQMKFVIRLQKYI